MSRSIPVYDIDSFEVLAPNEAFYANALDTHVRLHDFAELPHKHDFYLVVLITHGQGVHEIDFQTYEVKPGRLFIMQPGQMHFWKMSDDINGYVFFHNKEFYNKHLNRGVQDFNFFRSPLALPCLDLNAVQLKLVADLMRELLNEYNVERRLKWQKITSIISWIYIEVSREYSYSEEVKNPGYLAKLMLFENLLEENFKSIKMPRDYAALMNVSEKHLNRITRNCLNKTTTQLIGERLILEAQRMLLHLDLTISEISDVLGFNDPSYFIRFFKKHTGLTPLRFLNTYKQ